MKIVKKFESFILEFKETEKNTPVLKLLRLLMLVLNKEKVLNGVQIQDMDTIFIIKPLICIDSISMMGIN